MTDKKNEKMSRRNFLASAGGVAVGAIVAGTGLSLSSSEAEAGGLPEYPWTNYFDKKLDVEKVREKGTKYYHEGNHCGEATFRALTEELGHPFDKVPSQTMWFGAGGGAGWATLCGTVNGSGAAFSLLYGRTGDTMKLTQELFGWYSETPLPRKENSSQAKSVAGNPLCHASVTNWCEASGKKSFSQERADRCGRLAGDVAAKAAELLNAKLAGNFVPAYEIPEEAKECMNCHTKDSMLENTRGKMNCTTCHDDPHDS
ncbi:MULTISPECIES: C-GCAxxG-C-C family (seleno)protein [unclassified Candidatus Frackibacter]|uniref:C-GCAxxG-C-C family (seleno)protein n=1 Tax=unclassified Candidatus Frackibacter TaxID=2648818 RepID=UPI000886BBE5|nr:MULTISPECIES: C-GCAxxG-C-C family (seleno)protein [unclassified Candidatus Frackibacter]SDC78574.1 Putative redox-active protein (C_GCAxxG_C_C) [Candidatus Frackibacter sp. WG11]SEM91401.1 Putative redox-active protein (C_GCAxxG_C_C) [Candidatus Frackibacter sp. WG12]SFM01200.1 Putative redox-active protein (C_GCAxxG_C_C) [Candidatus Frackibacter sp. WG13]